MSAHTDPQPAAAPSPPPATARPLHARPLMIALVAAGGFLGTLCRWGAGRLVGTHGGWPGGTLAVNLTGAFVLGLLLEALAHHRDEGWRRLVRLGIGTGFCGALTTYSSFAVELTELTRGAGPLHAGGYLCVSVLGGLALAGAGVVLARRAHRGGGAR